MATTGRKKGSGPKEPEDAWERLARSNRAEHEGRNPGADEIGDTSRLVSRDRTQATLIEGHGPSSEILQLVTDSLAEAPERADLWMMRFEVQKTLGLKDAFAAALVEAWRHPRLNRQINWGLVRGMWEDLAPGDPVPENIRLPAPVTPAGPLSKPTTRPGAAVTPQDAPRDRRFADLANRIASRELAVLAKAYAALQARPGFSADFARAVGPLIRRPTPLQFTEQLSRAAGGQARIFLKREDLRSIPPERENAVAQCWIASALGRPAVVTAADVDSHALAVAEAAAYFKLRCLVVLKPGDAGQKSSLVAQLHERGAEIEAMGGATTGDPREGALRRWQAAKGQAHLVLSLGTGPNPYPAMINAFQALLGKETELQVRAQVLEGRERTMVAAVQSEADSIGFVLPQLNRDEVELVYAEPEPGGAASWRPSLRLQAYNGAVREHVWLRALGRIEHTAISDAQAQAAREQVRQMEKIELSFEDARAVALTLLLAQREGPPRDFIVLAA